MTAMWRSRVAWVRGASGLTKDFFGRFYCRTYRTLSVCYVYIFCALNAVEKRFMAASMAD
jgi:hypothetical protein